MKKADFIDLILVFFTIISMIAGIGSVTLYFNGDLEWHVPFIVCLSFLILLYYTIRYLKSDQNRSYTHDTGPGLDRSCECCKCGRHDFGGGPP